MTAAILEEMATGLKVYYDRRWRVSELLALTLVANPELVRGRDVLVLGCGVGLEALAAAQAGARFITLNDLSPLAVTLSRLQLRRNGFRRHAGQIGDYREMPLPGFDVALGSFLVYDSATLAAMLGFLERTDRPLLLANDAMDAYHDLLSRNPRRARRLAGDAGRPVVWFEARARSTSHSI